MVFNKQRERRRREREARQGRKEHRRHARKRISLSHSHTKPTIIIIIIVVFDLIIIIIESSSPSTNQTRLVDRPSSSVASLQHTALSFLPRLGHRPSFTHSTRSRKSEKVVNLKVGKRRRRKGVIVVRKHFNHVFRVLREKFEYASSVWDAGGWPWVEQGVLWNARNVISIYPNI